jgi:hypothetical protein
MVQLRLDESAVAWREVDGDIVVIDLKASQYLTLNAVGRFLWLRLAHGADETSLADALAAEASLDRARARSDVAAFVQDLRTRKFLVESNK